MRPPSKILIYRIGQLGDTIVSLPALWAIRRHFPKAHLTLLSDVHEETDYVLASKVLPAQGLIDEYLAYEAHVEGAAVMALFKTIPRLRERGFDTLVYLAPRYRTRRQIWRDLIFFRLSGITRFIGCRGMTTPDRLMGDSPLAPVDHETDHLLRRLERAGIAVPSSGQGCMDLLLTAAEKREARDWLHSRMDPASPYIPVGLGVGSKCPVKIWPLERFAALGRRLIDYWGCFPVVFGGPEDRERGDALVKEWRLGANAAGELTVRQAAAALSFCRLFVGNDTGTMHLAAAVGVPCVAVFTCRDLPGHWHPYGSHHITLRAQVACEGCMIEQEECLDYDMACIKLISIKDVAKACDLVLNRGDFPPGRLIEAGATTSPV